MVKDDGTKKVVTLLLWIPFTWIIGLIWALVDDNMRKDKFVKHHIKQWLVALIASMVLYFAATVLSVILIGFLLFPVIGILGIVWTVQGIIFSLNGDMKEIWLIGKFAKKFTF